MAKPCAKGNIMANTTFSGPVTSTNGFVAPTYTVATVPTVGSYAIGTIIYVSDGLAGAPTLAVNDGADWISAAGTAVADS
jgi:hypothetical protein